MWLSKLAYREDSKLGKIWKSQQFTMGRIKIYTREDKRDCEGAKYGKF